MDFNICVPVPLPGAVDWYREGFVAAHLQDRDKRDGPLDENYLRHEYQDALYTFRETECAKSWEIFLKGYHETVAALNQIIVKEAA